jgi:8-oxo-dGTP diphosphatase
MDKKGKYIYDWPRPMVTADAMVFAVFKNKIKLLLVNRGFEPFKGKWCLPGGFVNMDEELEDAAVRELAEETGLTGVHLELMHTFGKCGRDPRGRVITATFMGIVTDRKRRIKAGDDAAKARWFDIDKLPKDMAFDHDEVIAFGIRKLKKKKVYREHVKYRKTARRSS